MKRKLLLVALALIGAMSASANVTIETDLTSTFPVDFNGWDGATDFVGWAAPAVRTNDGRTTAACERYNDNADHGPVPGIGDIFTRTLTGLVNGTYRIELYGAAAYTPDRGIATEMKESNEGDMTAVYLYAETTTGTVKKYIPVHWAGDFNGSGIATAVLENVVITDGTVKLGMYKEKMYTNWHVIQIKGVTATADGDETIANLKAKAKEMQDDPQYVNVTGDELANLQAAYNAVPSENTVDAYELVISALNTAISAFESAKTGYDAFVTAKNNMASRNYPYAAEAIKTTAENLLNAKVANAAEAAANAAALPDAYRKLAESSAMLEGIEGAIDMTGLITNPAAEEETKGWNTVLSEDSGGVINVKDEQPWTDSTGGTNHKYFDGGDWGESAWNVTFKQEIALPAGRYQLTAIGRAEVDVTTMILFAGEKTAQMPCIGGDGSTGSLFNRGWEQTSVEFELEKAATIAIGVQGVTDKQFQWMSFSDFRLVAFEASVSVNVSEAGYATLSSTLPLDLTEVDAYIVTKTTDDDTIILDPCNGVVPANTGLIIAGEGEIEIPIADANAETIDVTNNYLRPTSEGVEEGDYVLATKHGEHVAAFYAVEEAIDAEPGKAFLSGKVVETGNETKVLRFVFGDDIATAIATAEVVETEADGTIYNVAGQQVAKDYKGIVIKNGKKYLNK